MKNINSQESLSESSLYPISKLKLTVVNCMSESDVMKKALKRKENSMIVKLLCLIKASFTIQPKSLMMTFHSNFTLSSIMKEPVEILRHQAN